MNERTVDKVVDPSLITCGGVPIPMVPVKEDLRNSPVSDTTPLPPTDSISHLYPGW